MAGARARGLDIPKPDAFDSVPGHGVVATVTGRCVLLGNVRLMFCEGVDVADLIGAAQTLAGDGKTAMYVAADGHALGVIAVADTVRDTARQGVRALHDADVRTVMLTGDNARTAGAVARALGIDTVIADVLPEDKAANRRRVRRSPWWGTV